MVDWEIKGHNIDCNRMNNGHICIVGVIFSLFTFVSCINEKKINHLSELNLTGNVKSCKHFDYYVTDNTGSLWKTKDGRKYYSYDFNKDGYIEQKKIFYPDVNIMNIINYTYDNKCLLKEEDSYWENIDSTKPYRSGVSFLDNEDMVAPEVNLYTVYKYESGKLKEIVNYKTEDGSLRKKSIYMSRTNKVSQIDYYNGDGERHSYETFEYLNSGVVKRNFYLLKFWTETDYLVRSECYKNDQLIKRTVSSINGALGVVYYDADVEYNKDGLVKKVSKGKWILGNLVNSTEEFNFVKEDFEYEYFFDDKGNWVRMIEYKGNAKIPVRVEDRMIEYY